jgi:hypothetical protein
MFQLKLIISGLLLLVKDGIAWNFVVFPDSECESTPSGEEKGVGTRVCTQVPASHRSFEISNMGSCRLFLYDSERTCHVDDWEQVYDAGNSDRCIPPDYIWDYYMMECLGGL